MTIRTGKSGRYRYYACAIKARQGETDCKGRAIPMDKLDGIVATQIEERLLAPDLLEDMLATVLDRRDAIEVGVADLDDPALKERVAGLKVIRDLAKVDAERAQAMRDSSGHSVVSPAMIRKFSHVARDHIRLDRGVSADHLRALAKRVEVAADEIASWGQRRTC